MGNIYNLIQIFYNYIAHDLILLLQFYNLRTLFSPLKLFVK